MNGAFASRGMTPLACESSPTALGFLQIWVGLPLSVKAVTATDTYRQAWPLDSLAISRQASSCSSCIFVLLRSRLLRSRHVFGPVSEGSAILCGRCRPDWIAEILNYMLRVFVEHRGPADESSKLLLRLLCNSEWVALPPLRRRGDNLSRCKLCPCLLA